MYSLINDLYSFLEGIIKTTRSTSSDDKDKLDAGIRFFIYSTLMTYSFRIFYEQPSIEKIRDLLDNRFWMLRIIPTIMWGVIARVVRLLNSTVTQLILIVLVTFYLTPKMISIFPPFLYNDRSIYGFFVPLSVGIFSITFSVFSMALNCIKEKSPYALKVYRQRSYFTVTQILLFVVIAGSSLTYLILDPSQEEPNRYMFSAIVLLQFFAYGFSVLCWTKVINIVKYDITVASAIDNMIADSAFVKEYTSNDIRQRIGFFNCQQHTDYICAEVISNSTEGNSTNLRFVLNSILSYFCCCAFKHHLYWYTTRSNIKLNLTLPLLPIETKYVHIYKELLRNSPNELFYTFFDHVCEVMSLRLRLNSDQSRLIVFEIIDSITKLLSSDIQIIQLGDNLLPKIQYTINTLMLVLNDYIMKINWGYKDLEIIQTDKLCEWIGQTILLLVYVHRYADYSYLVRELNFVNIILDSRNDEYLASVHDDVDRIGVLTIKYWNCLRGYRDIVQYMVLDNLVRQQSGSTAINIPDIYSLTRNPNISDSENDPFITECLNPSIIKNKRIEWLYTGLLIHYMLKGTGSLSYLSIAQYLNNTIGDTKNIRKYLVGKCGAIIKVCKQLSEVFFYETTLPFETAISTFFSVDSEQLPNVDTSNTS